MALLVITIPLSSLITSWWPSHFISLTVLPTCCLRPCCLSFTPFLQVPALSYCLNSFCCCLSIVVYHPPLELLSAVCCLLSAETNPTKPNKLLSAVCCLLSADTKPTKPNKQKTAVCCLLPAVCCLLFAVYCIVGVVLLCFIFTSTRYTMYCLCHTVLFVTVYCAVFLAFTVSLCTVGGYSGRKLHGEKK